MQVTESSKDGLKRELTISVEASDLNDRVMAKLNEMKNKVQLKGFRPGKVPVSHLRRTFGTQIMTEVIQETVTETSQQALDDKKWKPALQPQVDLETDMEQVVEGKVDLVFKVAFEIVPEIPLTDFSKICLERQVADVATADMEKALSRLAEQQKTYAKKDGKAKQGDSVVIDFLGKIDGEAFDGGAAEDASLVLGSNQFIPGFEDQLVGTEAGRDIEIQVTFPEEYGAENLAGKDAVFEVKVKEVQGAVDPVIDDTFAQRFGMEDLAKLKETVAGQIKADYDRAGREKMKRGLLDILDETHSFELPPTLVEREFAQIWEQFEKDLEQQGKTLEDAGQSEEKLRADYRGLAERRVRLGLVLADVGEKNDVQVTDPEVNQGIAERARQFPGQEEKVYEFYSKNPQAVAEIRAPIFEDKVVDFIAELADITEKQVTREELFEFPEESIGQKPAAKKTAKKKPAAKKAVKKNPAAKKTASKKTTAAKKKKAD